MKYKVLYNFYIFYIDIIYNMIYNKIIKDFTDRETDPKKLLIVYFMEVER